MNSVDQQQNPGQLSDHARIAHRPGAADVDTLRRALAPWRFLTDPRFHGLENIPASGAVLLVGNHTTFGLLDAPLMIEQIYRERGRFVRGLADHVHYLIPGWRELLTRAGAARGTRDNCRALLAAGEAVLVYPGGGREVAKRKNEKYQLIWQQRTGFARLAIEAGCPIVPFGAVGAEDSYDILFDADHPTLAPIRGLVERFGGRWDIIPPIPRGIGPTPLPRPERFYFAFGNPIDTTQWAGRTDDHTIATARDLVRDAVNDRIAFLLTEQAADPGRHLLNRARWRTTAPSSEEHSAG
ncbi:lysophospholipid acyltransferase family protein [Nocardia sp. NPDC088792]|uniref:lysophospholipid acyltransferase family protein n=1 Tax=Nocardia sp. NPDC088792 TaxID=3364332 RepID=UPI00381A83BB